MADPSFSVLCQISVSEYSAVLSLKLSDFTSSECSSSATFGAQLVVLEVL